MLVISRRAGETIHLGSDIKVTFVRVRGGQVRVAIDAPREVAICRAELLPDAPEAGPIPDGMEGRYNHASRIAGAIGGQNSRGRARPWMTRGAERKPLVIGELPAG